MSTEKSEAPWTNEQVQALMNWQNGESFVHPYTCDGAHCFKDEDVNFGELIPTKEGWICPCSHYRQNWCHVMSFSPVPTMSDFLKSKFPNEENNPGQDIQTEEK